MISTGQFRPRFSLAAIKTRLGRILFGDRIGIVVFLGTLLFLTLTWRVGFFINDNYTLANALVGLSQGHLYIDRIAFGRPTAPATVVSGDRLYGRNYGQLVVSLPVLFAFRGLFTLFDPRVVLVAFFSGLIAGFAFYLGHAVNRPVLTTYAGAGSALLLFGANLTLATDLSPRWAPVLALQLTSMIAAAFVGVILYRVTTSMYTQRVGVAAGIGVVLATPVGFWATIPKRHSLVALLAMLVLFMLYRSREATESVSATRYRAVAYAVVGYAAWVKPAEGVLLFIGLTVVDLPTARWNTRRALTVIGLAFGASLIPFFVTNALITGSPIKPVFLLPEYDRTQTVILAGEAITPPSTAGQQVAKSPSQNVGLAETIGVALRKVANYGLGGLVVLSQPDRLYHIFIRSSYRSAVTAESKLGAVNLTVLESMPLLGLLCAAVLIYIPQIDPRNLHKRTSGIQSVLSYWSYNGPQRVSDLFALVYTMAVILFSLPRLPIHASITVRYLHIIYPLGTYAIIRLAVVRKALHKTGQRLIWAYLVTVLIIGQLVVAGLALIQATVGEAMQLYAILALSTCALFICYSILKTKNHENDKYLSIFIGVAGGLTTVLLLLSSVELFVYNRGPIIPIIHELSKLPLT